MKIKLANKHINNNYAKSLLEERGISDVNAFLNPVESNLEDPSDLINTKEGMTFIKKALEEDGSILLLIDADCDGYCSAAIIYQYLRDLKDEIQLDVIAHDGKQHGLRDIVERVDFNIHDYKYMIIPDASTNDQEYFAMYPNTNFLILDHHESDAEELETLGDNYIIINNQLSPKYENKALCGAGVTWQFCRYLYQNGAPADPAKYVDLAAVATVSDIMDSKTRENTYIVDQGLTNINNSFLIELINTRKDQFPTLDDVTQDKLAWYTTPIINGMCRSGEYDEKIRMFYAFVDGHNLIQDTKRGANPGDTVTLSQTAAREAKNAKSRQDNRKKKMTELAQIKIAELQLLDNKILTLVLDERFSDLPASLNGVVANQLAQAVNRPVILGRVNDEGWFRGSGRGLESIDMPGFRSFLQSSNMFEYVSGHENAFGFSIKYHQLDKFHDWANEELKRVNMDEDAFQVDFLRSGRDEDIADIVFDIDLHAHIWGNHNKPPIIGVLDLNVSQDDIQILGRSNNTIKIIKDGVEYMFFRLTEDEITEFTDYELLQIDLVGTMSMNTWGGRSTPQIIANGYEVRDGKFAF